MSRSPATTAKKPSNDPNTTTESTLCPKKITIAAEIATTKTKKPRMNNLNNEQLLKLLNATQRIPLAVPLLDTSFCNKLQKRVLQEMNKRGIIITEQNYERETYEKDRVHQCRNRTA